MSPKKWIEATNAIGIVSKAGRCDGTYAHSDIAMANMRNMTTSNQLLALANLESYTELQIYLPLSITHMRKAA